MGTIGTNHLKSTCLKSDLSVHYPWFVGKEAAVPKRHIAQVRPPANVALMWNAQTALLHFLLERQDLSCSAPYPLTFCWIYIARRYLPNRKTVLLQLLSIAFARFSWISLSIACLARKDGLTQALECIERQVSFFLSSALHYKSFTAMRPGVFCAAKSFCAATGSFGDE